MKHHSSHERAVKFARHWMSTSSPQMRKLFVEQLEQLLREVVVAAQVDSGGRARKRD